MHPRRELDLRALGSVRAYSHPPGHIEVPPQDTDVLIYHVSGSRSVSRRVGRRMESGSRPGSFSHIAAGSAPVFEVSGPCRVLHFDIPAGVIPRAGFFDLAIQPVRPIAASLAAWMWGTRNVRGSESIASGLVLGAADLLTEPGVSRGGLRPAVRRDLSAWIEAELSSPLAELDIAARAGLSPGHLRRAFRESFGLPPMRYIASRRAALARSLLERGEPMSVVAIRCGLSGPRALRDLLRRH